MGDLTMLRRRRLLVRSVILKLKRNNAESVHNSRLLVKIKKPRK